MKASVIMTELNVLKWFSALLKKERCENKADRETKEKIYENIIKRGNENELHKNNN